MLPTTPLSPVFNLVSAGTNLIRSGRILTIVGLPKIAFASSPENIFDTPKKLATNLVCGLSYTSSGVPTCSIEPSLKTVHSEKISFHPNFCSLV